MVGPSPRDPPTARLFAFPAVLARVTSPLSGSLHGGCGGVFRRPTVPWIAAGAVMLALLTAIPAVSLGAPPSGRETSHPPTQSDATQRALPDACSSVTSCPRLLEPHSDARGPDPESYQLNHTTAWSQVTAPPSGFGVGGGLIANSSSGIAVAFGGVSSGALVNSTFAYHESTNLWSGVSTPTAPTPRSDFAFALDPTTGTAVLFGGLTNLTTLGVSNETWTYTVGSERWSSSTHGLAPPAREAAAFAIVPALGVAVLSGGWNRNFSMTGSLTYSDLWELNLSTGAWSQLSVPGPHPPPLEGATMVWDPLMQRLDMFGGCYPCSSAVWQFDPGSPGWTLLATPPTAPPARAEGSWAYDPTFQADLLFGGTNGVTSFNDTHLFYPADDTWVAETVPPAPAARSDSASAFLDVANNETWLLAGGRSATTSYSDLWRLSATSNLSLRVVNASSPLSPLAGAEVNLSGRRAGSTDPAGYLNLTQVDTVGAVLNVTDVPWFSPHHETLWLPPGKGANLTVDLTPEPLGNLEVQVVSSLVTTFGHPPIPGAFVNLSVDAVRINRAPAVTNGSGGASFHGVPPGDVNLTAQAVDWRPAVMLGVLAPGGALNLTVMMVPDPLLTVTVLGRLPGGSSTR